MIFNRLAIGTANWGKEYNGAKVSEDDQKRILTYCRINGIDMIDTATAYEWDWTKIDPWFKVVVKTQKGSRLDDVWETNPYCVMAHDGVHRVGVNGVSLYEPRKLLGFTISPKIVQAPYSIYDRRFEEYFVQWKTGYDPVEEIHVRSVFLRGKLLKDFSPQDCISFCLMNPNIDRVILGADSFEQFKHNLFLLEIMCEAKKEDENLLDTRKWKEEK